MGDTVTREQSGTACTDAERRAALALAAELRAAGREVRVQTIWVHTAWWAPPALGAVLGIAASVICVGTPVTGLVVSVAALAITLADLPPAAPMRRLTPARATQNVVSAPAEVADGAVTLIITAALDRARRGLALRLPGGVLRWTIAALILVAACCVARTAGVDGDWIGVVQLPPTLVLLISLVALLDAAVADPVAGDRAAVDAAMDLVAALDAAPPRHLAVALVLAGAGGGQSAGLRSWLRARRRRGLDPRDIALLHLEPTPGDAPSWWRRDGDVTASALHPQLVRAARAAAEAEPSLRARDRSRPRGTAGGRARAAGWPALSVGVGEGADGVAFTLAIVAALDAELAALAR